jgi:hypothetical protein
VSGAARHTKVSELVNATAPKSFAAFRKFAKPSGLLDPGNSYLREPVLRLILQLVLKCFARLARMLSQSAIWPSWDAIK